MAVYSADVSGTSSVQGSRSSAVGRKTNKKGSALPFGELTFLLQRRISEGQAHLGCAYEGEDLCGSRRDSRPYSERRGFRRGAVGCEDEKSRTVLKEMFPETKKLGKREIPLHSLSLPSAEPSLQVPGCCVHSSTSPQRKPSRTLGRAGECSGLGEGSGFLGLFVVFYFCTVLSISNGTWHKYIKSIL